MKLDIGESWDIQGDWILFWSYGCQKNDNNIDFTVEFLFMYKNKSSKFKNTCVTRLPKFDIKNEKPIPHIPEINADQICKKKEKTDVSSQKW